MSLHSNRSFRLWTASGCIGHPQMACFAFLARAKTADSWSYDHFVSGSKLPKKDLEIAQTKTYNCPNLWNNLLILRFQHKTGS
jgi:hypothetical protein